jgi:hypothetical protein
MFVINRFKLCLILFSLTPLNVAKPSFSSSDRQYHGKIGPKEEILNPQVIFRNEGELASSLSFGHLAIELDVTEADRLAVGIQDLLVKTAKLIQMPFPGNDAHPELGKTWTQAAWNRTANRFHQAHHTYVESLRIFFQDLDTNMTPGEVTSKSTEKAPRPSPTARLTKDTSSPVRNAHSTTTTITPASQLHPVTPIVQDVDYFRNNLTLYHIAENFHAPVDVIHNFSLASNGLRSRSHGAINRFSDLSLKSFMHTPSVELPLASPIEPAFPKVESSVHEAPSGATDTSPHHREKRFAVILGGILVGGLLTTLGISINNAVKIAGIDAGSVSQEQADFIVKTLQSHADLLAEASTELKVATSEIETLRVRGYQNTLAIQAVLEHSRALQMTNMVIDEFERVTDTIALGLRQLLDGKLNTNLIPPSTIVPLVNQLKEKAEQAELSTPITETAAIYSLGCSFVAKSLSSLTVIIHLPLTRPNSVMTMYKFLDLGFAIPNTNLSVSIDVESEYLAVNKDRTGFLLLDNLDDCLTVGTLKMCPGQNFLIKSFGKYCISSLYMGKTAAAEDVCSMNVLPDQVRVVQQDRTQYYVFHPLYTSLSIDQCTDPKDNRKLTFRGTKLVEIQDGCFGHSDDYQLNPLVELGLKLTGSVSFTNKLSLPKLLKGVPVKTLAELYPKPPLQPTRVTDIAAQYKTLAKAGNPFALAWPFHFPAIFGSSFLTIGLVIFLLFFCCCREKLPSWFQRRSPQSNQGLNINLNPNPGIIRQESIPLNEVDDFINPHNRPRSRRNSLSNSIANLARAGANSAGGAFSKVRGSVSRLNLALGMGRHNHSDYESGPPSSQNTTPDA